MKKQKTKTRPAKPGDYLAGEVNSQSGIEWEVRLDNPPVHPSHEITHVPAVRVIGCVYVPSALTWRLNIPEWAESHKANASGPASFIRFKKEQRTGEAIGPLALELQKWCQTLAAECQKLFDAHAASVADLEKRRQAAYEAWPVPDDENRED